MVTIFHISAYSLSCWWSVCVDSHPGVHAALPYLHEHLKQKLLTSGTRVTQKQPRPAPPAGSRRGRIKHTPSTLGLDNEPRRGGYGLQNLLARRIKRDWAEEPRRRLVRIKAGRRVDAAASGVAHYCRWRPFGSVSESRTSAALNPNIIQGGQDAVCAFSLRNYDGKLWKGVRDAKLKDIFLTLFSEFWL